MVQVTNLQCSAIKTECDIFALNPVQNTVLDTIVSTTSPVSILSETGPIEIIIPPTSDYFDLSNTILYLTGKLVKLDGTALSSSDNSTLVNLPAQSIFEKITVSFNNKIVSTNPNYSYRSYIETILNFSSEAKDGHLRNQMFYKDIAGKFNDIGSATSNSSNSGYTNRKTKTSASKEFEIIAPLHLDICNQPKYLIDNVEVSFKFYPNSKPEFYCMGETPCKINIIDIFLIIRKVKINPLIQESHAKILQQVPARYPINRIDVKTVTIAQGNMSKIIDNIYLGPLPNRLIVGFVSSKAFNGDYKMNPYNFQHFNLKEIAVYFDNTLLPGMPIKMDYEKDKYALAYHTIFAGTGRNFSDSGNAITMEDYKNGYNLYCFDLTVDNSSSSNYWSIEKAGCMSIQIHFGSELEENITAILYSEFDNLLEIDKFRNILTDYAS